VTCWGETQACSSNERQRNIDELLLELESVQSQLSSFLDNQRAEFPRFNLLSNEALPLSPILLFLPIIDFAFSPGYRLLYQPNHGC